MNEISPSSLPFIPIPIPIQSENSGGSQYGQHWKKGDIVGVCIDMDEKKLSYTLNGEEMGAAFNGISYDEKECAPNGSNWIGVGLGLGLVGWLVFGLGIGPGYLPCFCFVFLLFKS